MVNKLKSLIAIICIVLLGGAWPSSGRYPVGAGSGGSGAAYTGPGDIISASAWWGLRAYTAALASSGASTTPVMDVLGSGTVTACTIYLNGDGTGGIDLTTAGAGGIGHPCLLGATHFCTVTNTSCSVSKLYDQTAGTYCGGVSCPMLQATAAVQPTLTFNCVGALPCTTSDGTKAVATNTSINSTAQPFTLTVEAERTGNTGAFAESLGDYTTNSNGGIFFNNSPNQVMIFAGSVAGITTANDNVVHSVIGVFAAGSAGVIVVDGVATTGLNAGAGSPALNDQLAMFTDAAAQPLTGNVMEGGIWSSALNSTKYNAMASNMAAFW